VYFFAILIIGNGSQDQRGMFCNQFE